MSTEGALRQLLDSELADLLVVKMRHLRAAKTPVMTAIRSDAELTDILCEFRRRADAHAIARDLYRARHLSKVPTGDGLTEPRRHLRNTVKGPKGA